MLHLIHRGRGRAIILAVTAAGVLAGASLLVHTGSPQEPGPAAVTAAGAEIVPVALPGFSVPDASLAETVQEQIEEAAHAEREREEAERQEAERVAAERAAAEQEAAAAAEATSRSTASAGGTVWDRLAQCESSGNWSHSGGTYHGGLQFHPQTWSAHKDASMPAYAYQASRSQQIVVAERVLASQGWGAWPACASKLGLR